MTLSSFMGPRGLLNLYFVPDPGYPIETGVQFEATIMVTVYFPHEVRAFLRIRSFPRFIIQSRASPYLESGTHSLIFLGGW